MTKNPKYTHYSITISPTIEEFNKMKVDGLIVSGLIILSKHYIIAEEKGASEDLSHYQIYMETEKEIRQDKIRLKIKKLIEKHYQLTNIKVALKVKPINTNINGVIGYTLKEGNKIYTNMKQELLTRCKEEYLKFENKKKLDKEKYKINCKNYHIKVELYIKNNLLEEEGYCYSSLVKIVGAMINEGYYFTFLTPRNYKDKMVYLQNYLNKNGEETLRYLQKLNEDIY